MELELDLGDNRQYWQIAAVLAVILALVGLAAIGSNITPIHADGSPKVMSWSDWRLIQAEKIYHAELEVLQADADQLADMLNSHPSPVAAQILAERISKHTASGDPSLAIAREALAASALNVRDWAAGILDRDTAVQSLQTTYALLHSR